MTSKNVKKIFKYVMKKKKVQIPRGTQRDLNDLIKKLRNPAFENLLYNSKRMQGIQSCNNESVT